MTNQNNGKYLPRDRKGRKNSPVSRILLVVALVSALIFGVTVFIALRNQIALKRMAAEAAQETTQASTAALTEPTVPVQTQSTVVPPITAATTPPTEPREILPRFLELYQKNPDLAGWLTIPGTRIDYPVMYSPDEPERYLHANFEVSYSFAGLPFIDAACDPESGNRIIYAHNMLDGSMFRTLLKYQQKDFWQRNPVISFNTLYEEQEYEVVAAFTTRSTKRATQISNSTSFMTPLTRAASTRPWPIIGNMRSTIPASPPSAATCFLLWSPAPTRRRTAGSWSSPEKSDRHSIPAHNRAVSWRRPCFFA